MEDPSRTSFGFENVSPDLKTDKVKDVFRQVAEKYDVMNDVMSMGLHRLWKTQFVRSLPLSGRPHILDMACGTGDISEAILRHTPQARLTLGDINKDMLRVGQQKHKGSRLSQCPWLCVDATDLPFEDMTFDIYVIAFGIRNVTGLHQALKEARRVLKPGGYFSCLEFSTVFLPCLKKVYDLYAFHAIPKFGEWILGNAQPYQYLVESIERFPDQETFKQTLKNSGFENVRYQNLNFGVASIHRGWRV